MSLANRVWGLGLSREQLLNFGAEVGSDVPFFLSGGAAICRGRGERVSPVRGIRPLHFVIVKPTAGLSTADVYRAYDALTKPVLQNNANRLEQLIATLRSRRYGEIGQWMMNRLETAATKLLPWIREVRAVFEQLGCLGHQLSGSGSSYFGICRHDQQARRLAAALKVRRLGLVYATSSCQ
jgi:4-diphosphocytidyl-2-C-methyl-D-erythritol kinase